MAYYRRKEPLGPTFETIKTTAWESPSQQWFSSSFDNAFYASIGLALTMP